MDRANSVRRVLDPWRDRQPTIEKILRLIDQGLSLRKAAQAAGVHVATVCRWQIVSTTLYGALHEAADRARRRKYASRPLDYDRPPVPIHPCCPWCRKLVDIKTGTYGFYFWQCSKWPDCGWRSWRPRAPWDCPCGGALLWSWNRKTVVCIWCEKRTKVSEMATIQA